jgi:hypothetical protein
MYIQWRDGTGLYCYHGVRVPGWILTNPELITIKKINEEMNTEVKRVMMLKFGIGRYISESGAKILHQDIDALGSERVLYEMEIDDEKVLTVKVINSTPEPDGSVNVYFLSVHPELRRMRRTKGGMVVFGGAQELTCANAVASTFGLTGEVYTSLLTDES